MSKRVLNYYLLLIITNCIIGSCSQSEHTNTVDLIPFRSGEKWGYANSDKTLIIPLLYNKAFPFWGTVAVVQKGKDYKLINQKGVFLSDYKFVLNEKNPTQKLDTIIQEYSLVEWFHEGETFAFLEKDKGWGMVNRQGEVVVKPFGESCEYKGAGCWAFREGNKWALYSSEGNKMTAFKYERIDKFYSNRAVAYLKDTVDWSYSNSMTYLDVKGREVTGVVYYAADTFSEGLAKVGILPQNSACKNLLYGFIDSLGNTILEPKYSGATAFVGGQSIIEKDTSCTWIGDSHYGVINKEGKIILPTEYVDIHPLRDNYYKVIKKIEGSRKKREDKEEALFNSKGKQIVPFSPYSYELTESWILDFGANGGIGMRDLNGKVIIPVPELIERDENDDPFPSVFVNIWEDNFAYINPRNLTIEKGKLSAFKIEPSTRYNYIELDFVNDEGILEWSGYQACIDRKGEIITQVQKENYFYANEHFRVKKEGLVSYPVNKKGEKIGSYNYSNIMCYNLGATANLIRTYVITKRDSSCYSSKQNGVIVPCPDIIQWGLLNQKGEVVLPPVALAVEKISTDWYAVTYQNEKTGIIDSKGAEILAPIYKEIGAFKKGIALVEIEGQEGYINKELVAFFE